MAMPEMSGKIIFQGKRKGQNMRVEDFDFDHFLRYKEEKDAFFKKFDCGEYRGPVMTQRCCGKAFGLDSTRKETALEAWLDNMDTNSRLLSDVGFTYMEPWAGVPVFANAFGAKLFWNGKTDVQSLPRYSDVSEVANVPVPAVGDCELMQMVLEYIRYFKEQTHGLIPLSLTDTQSPCDTASLILDPCELFSASLEEPEALTDFLTKITRCIGDFTEMQMELIGEDLLSTPGHMMISSTGGKGIAVSDDNLAVISRESYAVIGIPWNAELGRRFGGLAVHSCGLVTHNTPQLLAIPGIRQFDCKVTDFEPNDAEKLAEQFKNKETVLKVCVYPEEDNSRLIPLLRSDVKLLVEVFTHGTVEERNRQYAHTEEFVRSHIKKIPEA